MPTITQQYWTYFWKMVEEYLPMVVTQISFLKSSRGIDRWSRSQHPSESHIPGMSETMWGNIPWTPHSSPNHRYSRTLKNKSTMLSAFISFIETGPISSFPIKDDGSFLGTQPLHVNDNELIEVTAERIFEFIEFLFFKNDGVRGQSQQDEIARKEMIIKLAEEWLYKSPMSVKQGVDVIMSPGGYSPFADDPSDLTMGQLMIEMSNPGGEGGSHRTGDDDDPEFVVIMDVEDPDIEKIFQSLLQNDIWGVEQTRAELEIGEQDPHTLDSLVDTCCGCPLMLYMMILFLMEIGFNQKIGTPFLTDQRALIPFPQPKINLQQLNWTNLMNLFEDEHPWRVVINRREPDPQP